MRAVEVSDVSYEEEKLYPPNSVAIPVPLLSGALSEFLCRKAEP
jgi:hypothetical protein